jgi:phosphoribosyl 1,2-cyclic phosphate phosphodiesterase
MNSTNVDHHFKLSKEVMKVTFLGTGTSTGIPLIGCRCATCQSNDPKDKRLRTSVWLETPSLSVIIDAGIDFRQQALIHKITNVDAVLYTHHHVDHIFGLDELRPINFIQNKTINIFGTILTLEHLRRIYPYVFDGQNYPSDIPKIKYYTFEDRPFQLGNLTVIPIPVYHGELLIHGFRIGNFAYLTDLNHIPAESYPLLERLEVLVLDALRDRPHPTHFTLEQALNEARKIGARKTFLVHMSHELSHLQMLERLPPEIQPAFDGLQLELSIVEFLKRT